MIKILLYVCFFLIVLLCILQKMSRLFLRSNAFRRCYQQKNRFQSHGHVTIPQVIKPRVLNKIWQKRSNSRTRQEQLNALRHHVFHDTNAFEKLTSFVTNRRAQSFNQQYLLWSPDNCDPRVPETADVKLTIALDDVKIGTKNVLLHAGDAFIQSKNNTFTVDNHYSLTSRGLWCLSMKYADEEDDIQSIRYTSMCELRSLYRLYGYVKYDQHTTQLRHAVEMANLARLLQGQEDDKVFQTICLLHNIGVLIEIKLNDGHKNNNNNVSHADLGSLYLKNLGFDLNVTEPIRLQDVAQFCLFNGQDHQMNFDESEVEEFLKSPYANLTCQLIETIQANQKHYHHHKSVSHCKFEDFLPLVQEVRARRA